MKIRVHHYRCDSCGTTSPACNSVAGAQALANRAGWRITARGKRDLCTTCRRTERDEIAALIAAVAVPASPATTAPTDPRGPS